MDSKWKKKREKAIVFVGMLGNKKNFVSLTYARRRSFQKTLRVTTSNYRLFLLVDHSDKIPETI